MAIHRMLTALALVGLGAAAACSLDSSKLTPNPAEEETHSAFHGGVPSMVHASMNAGSSGGQQGSCSGPTVDTRVTQTLTEMANTLAKANTIVFSALTSTEDVSSTLQKLQFDTSIHGIVKRPNQLFVEKSGAENVTIWFDGATAIILDRSANTFIRASINGDIDTLLAKLDDLQVEAPFGGLLGSDLQKKFAEYVYQGDYYAPALIDDRQTHHLAMRQENVDWQLWVDMETWLPKKAVITSKMLAGAPEHLLLIKDIKIDATVPQGSFTPSLPAGAREVPVPPSNP